MLLSETRDEVTWGSKDFVRSVSLLRHIVGWERPLLNWVRPLFLQITGSKESIISVDPKK